MAQSRYYSSTAQPTVLVNTITPTSTSIQLQQVIGYPVNTPFVIALDYNTSGEELALVTNVAGTTMTITRAFDGTSAASHNIGAGVRHVSCAVDFNDSRLHESLNAGVHGIVGSVVGTTDTQTLTNKTISGGNINGTINGSPTWANSQTFGNGATFPNGFNAGSTNQLAVDSSGDINTSGTLIAAGATVASLAVTNGATVGTTLGVTGNATVGGTLGVTGNTTVTGNLSVGGIGGFLFARKTTDLTRTNTTTLANDPDLTFTVAANAVYVIQGGLYYLGDPSVDINFSWSLPTGAKVVESILAQDFGATSTVGTIITDLQGTGNGISLDNILLGTITTQTLTAPLTGLLITSGTSGTAAVSWAQRVASPSLGTTLRTNSYIYLRRVA